MLCFLSVSFQRAIIKFYLKLSQGQFVLTYSWKWEYREREYRAHVSICCSTVWNLVWQCDSFTGWQWKLEWFTRSEFMLCRQESNLVYKPLTHISMNVDCFDLRNHKPLDDSNCIGLWRSSEEHTIIIH